MSRKIIKKAMFGFMLGMLAGNLIAFLSRDKTADPIVIVSPILIQRSGSETQALIVQTLLSGLLGAVGMAGTIFFEFDDWGMTKAMAVHFLAIIATLFPIAFWCGWISPDGKEVLIMLLIEAAAYLAIWLIMFLRCRKETKDLNELIRKQ